MTEQETKAAETQQAEEPKPEVIEPDSDDAITVTDTDIPVEFRSVRGKGGEEAKSEEGAGEASTPPPDGEEAEEKTGEAKAKDDWKSIPKNVRKRVARVSRQRDEAQQELDRLKQENEELRKAQGAKPEPEELDPEDFDTFDDYLKAQDEQKKPKQEPEAKPDPDEGLEFGRLGKDGFLKAFGDLKETVQTDDPDVWDKALEAKQLNMSADLIAALNEADKPTELLSALVDDPEQAKEISGMDPFKQARALANLERKLGRKPAQKTNTDAPEPIEASQARGFPPPRGYAEMSQSEFEQKRNEEEAARGGRFGW